ncbi:hypothetical protein ABVK25_002823 [Lepraria finkii]|uniref:Uncharacterized protein n=1 Tax=Lepraria finkii TaxID=1340010 RepID=A0ABR4BGY6_9LECA
MADSKAEDLLPYWLVHVPEDQRPEKCPDFLRNISDRNKAIVSVPENEFLSSHVDGGAGDRANGIDKFRRAPLDHRRYLAFMAQLSVMNFIRDNRAKWTDVELSEAAAFLEPTDCKILYNDWPYGIDEKIVHLVVWTKFVLEDDPETNDLTPKMRKEINEYIGKMFRTRVPSDNVSQLLVFLVLMLGTLP